MLAHKRTLLFGDQVLNEAGPFLLAGFYALVQPFC